MKKQRHSAARAVLAAGAAMMMTASPLALAPAAWAIQDEAVAPTAAEVAAMVQAAIDALPANATQAQIETAILNVLATSGADVGTVADAMAIVASNNAGNPAVVMAATNAATAVASGRVTTGGRGSNGSTNTPPPPPSTPGGGTSDY